MAYVALPRFLFRAPLLPMRALRDPRRSVTENALGAKAIELASPALAAALARAPKGADAASAVERYGRRAAFRPTPHGLWAGVGVGRTAARTDVRTPAPRAHLAAAWMRMAGLGRAVLDQPGVRAHVRLRRAPSLTMGPRTVTWLGPGAPDGFCEEHVADLDDALEAVIQSCSNWTAWSAVRGALAAPETEGAEDDEADALDDWLLTLIDDGLLLADTIPPLLGPPAGEWMVDRLTRLPASDIAGHLESVRAALRACDLAAATAALTRLPGDTRGQTGSGVQGTLLFPTGAKVQVTLSRHTVARAAALAPLLFRMQEALAPPAAERTPGRALAEALDATTEIFGAGALDLAALARGDYGTTPASEDSDAPDIDSGAATPLVALLVDRIVAAARAGHAEIALDSGELGPLLPVVNTPPTCELFLTPRRPRPRDRAGAGWLLGLHAPAGASWGRFAAALADDDGARNLFAELKIAEQRARPDETPLDVVFAPSPRLAELCAHPPLRDAALALSGWPADDRAAVTLGELELVADPAALEPLALRTRGHAIGAVVTPSPLHRVRSTTAPSGVWRLLVGWSLRRQHAPWALEWGPLAGMAWTPRVTLDGFVIAPASWRLPAGATTTARLATWRKAHRVPRFVQVGHEDERLPVDLTVRDAPKLLAGHDRVHEIWPPLGDTPDRAGRRIEAVIALVDAPDVDQRAFAAASAAATRTAGAVPVPGRDASALAWLTFKLFGAADRQDAVLADVVAPLLATARQAGWLTGWFFQRYVEGPGRRPHLRLRAAGNTTALAHALDAQLEEARRAGDVVSVEQAPYFPEAARFGGAAAMPTVHALFQAASELVLAALMADDDGEWAALATVDDPLLFLLIGACDALARAAGLDAARRRAFAQQRRAAHAGDVDEDFSRSLADGFRHARPALRTLLGGAGIASAKRTPRPAAPASSSFTCILGDFEDAAGTALARLSPAERTRNLAALMHLDAVRLLGTDREAEIRAYTYWERALDSLERHSAAPAARER